MEVHHLKIILLAVMFLIALILGLLPMKIFEYVKKKQQSGSSRLASLLLSLLSCFAGGVFLGVCLLDLFPFANESFELVKEETGYETEYPFVELIVGAGFFFVYFVEEISLKICKYDGNDDEEVVQVECKECERTQGIQNEHADGEGKFLSVDDLRLRSTSILVAAKKNISTSTRSSPHDFVKSITFIVAFTFHSCLEGFAFGVQKTSMSVATLFFGIIVHKAVIAFSIGMRLIRCHPERSLIIVALIVFVALTAPIGGAIGIAIQDSNINGAAQNIVSTVLTCTALGTFLYITFFEILYAEQSNSESRILQFLSTFAGFSIIALLMLAGE